LWLFSGRDDPADRDEQYEKLYIMLLDANKFDPKVKTYAVGDAENTIELGDVFDELIAKVATRNPDHYEQGERETAQGSLAPELRQAVVTAASGS
jgi:hypothetical protein